jgi:hypothetical protein
MLVSYSLPALRGQYEQFKLSPTHTHFEFYRRVIEMSLIIIIISVNLKNSSADN